MPKRQQSPEELLTTRMTFHLPAEASEAVSVLDFPYTKAFTTFMRRLEQIYEHQHPNEKLPFRLRPPFRQFNDVLLTLAPSLIQGFEDIWIDNKKTWRALAFTHYHTSKDGRRSAEDFPTLGQLQSLIHHWLTLWGEHREVKPLLEEDGKQAWEDLMIAVKGDPETEWDHGRSLSDLTRDFKRDGLGFDVIPAYLTARLHQKEMTIHSGDKTYLIKWRRANQGGKRGLHLVSQPIRSGDDYFAYRLDFNLQTQVGFVDEKGGERFWVFAHLSIQRYISAPYGGDQNRNVSVLMGYNREQFRGGWDRDTTLIRFGVDGQGNQAHWESGVERLLSSFSIVAPIQPTELLDNPMAHGRYGDNQDADNDEYYIIYAEGRKFGETERGHQVKTGMSLRERSLIMEGVLRLLDETLQKSEPLMKDVQTPERPPLALRDYDYMVDERDDNSKQVASWRKMLRTSLANSGCEQAHLIVLYRSEDFRNWAQQQVSEALMGLDQGDEPLAKVTFAFLPLSYYTPLDPGELDPQIQFRPTHEKPAGFAKAWKDQMRVSREAKRNEWQTFLRGLDWEPNARRLILIDSPGKFPNTPDDQQSKGAIREACLYEGIVSQFIVGTFKIDKRSEDAKLEGESSGRLKNAVLDLLVRQQGILYGTPAEMYEKVACMDATTAKQLDVIAFCRVTRQWPKIRTILAVRLRADGEVDALLPGDDTWLPYDAAIFRLGDQFVRNRGSAHNDKPITPFHFSHEAMVNFIEHVLKNKLERPTIAVIEAEGWRNARGYDETKHCWSQLQNARLFQSLDKLDFGMPTRIYQRNDSRFDNLLGVVRLRMNAETPQYITADDWSDEEDMRDIAHLTSYVDPHIAEPLHYMSIAGLSEGQKRQKDEGTREALKGDPKGRFDNIAYKHPQIVEMVPFFARPDFQYDEGQRQLCRCLHFLRLSPGFTLGEIVTPYPMHLGESLVDDLLVLIGAED